MDGSGFSLSGKMDGSDYSDYNINSTLTVGGTYTLSQGCDTFSLSTGLSGHEGIDAEHDAYVSANFDANDGSGFWGSVSARVQYQLDGSGNTIWEASGDLYFSKAGGLANTTVQFVVSEGGEEVRVNYSVTPDFTATCTGGRSASGDFNFTIGLTGHF